MTVEELQILVSAKMEAAQAKVQKLKDTILGLQPKKAVQLDISTRPGIENLRKFQAEMERTQAKLQAVLSAKGTMMSQQLGIVNKYHDSPDLPKIYGMSDKQVAIAAASSDPAYQRLSRSIAQLDQEIEPLNARVEETKMKLESLYTGEKAGAESTKQLGMKINQTGGHVNEFSRRMNMMLLRIALLRGLSFVFRSISEGFQNIAKGNDSANASLSQLSTSTLYLKNSIAASLMPAVQAVTPIITQLIDALAGAFNTISMFTARIFGNASAVTIAKRASVDYAKTLGGVSTSADKAKGSLAAFDQINTISRSNAASSGSGSAGMPAAGDMFETVQIPQTVGDTVDKIKASLADITAAAAFAKLAIGTILVLSGANIPLGLGLMSLGAAELAADIAVNWGTSDASLRNELTTITSSLGGFLLVLGAFLTFTGANVPLGLGLMIAGAANLATAVAINWGSNTANVSTVMSAITGAVSEGVLALGALFALTGVDVPLGVGLMLAGALGLASVVALNWSSMSDSTKETVATITGIVGGALLALGAILTLTGAAPALGIPMMVVGAGVLATTIVLNWNSMSDQLKSTLTAITLIVGTFFLVLGAILIFSGAGIPLGIALLIAGAGSLATAAALNWNAIKDGIVDVLSSILAIASTALVAMGIILCLTGAGIPLGIGLIMAGMAGVGAANDISSNPITEWAKNLMNGVIGVFESGVNWIISMLNRVRFTVPDWVLGIGGRTYGINLSQVYIPRLAEGGVVRGATPLLAGENGAEAIVPLKNNTEWTAQVAALIQKQGGSENPTEDFNFTIPVYLDRNGTLIDTIIKKYTRTVRANG